MSAAATTTSRWAGVPAEDRRAARRALLLDAAFELLGTDGDAATSVRAVCHAAQLNPRYFYESFDDLDALLVALFDQLMGELTGAVLASVAEVVEDPAASTRAGIETIVRYVSDDPRRARVLFVEALGNEAIARRRIETVHAVAQFVERTAAQQFGAPPPGERIGAMAASLLVGGFGELLVSWLDGRLDVSREQLVADTTELFLGTAATAAAIAERRAGC